MKRLASYFLQGLVFLVPIAVPLYVLVWVFLTVDGWLALPVPGAGLLVVVVSVTLLGFLLSSFLLRRLLSAFESVLERLPLVKLLHGAVKDLMGAVAGEKRRFDRPVLVTLGAGSTARALGFVTRDSLEALGLPEDVAVYLPQAYNFAGQLLIVPRTAVVPLPVEAGAVMTFIVSGGVSGGVSAP